MNTEITNFTEIKPRENAAYWQTEPSVNTSDRYKLISTSRVADFFRQNGFVISHYNQAGTIKPEYHGKSKHIVRLRRISDIRNGVDDAPEILIINSHNKYTSLKLNIGIYRYACCNGLILGDTFFSGRVTHTGRVEEQLQELLRVIDVKFNEVNSLITIMKNTRLTELQQISLMDNVLKIRTGKEVTVSSFDKTFNLKPKRDADKGDDLYTVMNVLQEKAVNGGLFYSTSNKNNETIYKTSREIKGLTSIEKINKQIFDSALTFLPQMQVA
jgi:hypothetical protein